MSGRKAGSLISVIKTFLGLTDTPSSYAGQGGKAIKVNSGATALEFVTAWVSTFLGLTDTPASFAGQAGKASRVNSGETALEFSHPAKIQDAAGVTKVDVEESAAEKIVRMDVDSVEAFKLNADGILDLAKQSAIRTKNTNELTIPTGTWTKVTLDLEDFDVQNEFDSVTNYRFTAKKAGKYSISLWANWDGIVSPAANNAYRVGLWKNDAYDSQGISHASQVMAISAVLVSIVSLAANDFLDMYAYHATGTNRYLYAGFSFMAIHKLS